jgi:adenylylsulfate kinase
MNGYQGAVMWFTGLSGAGKTTTARYAAGKLRERGRLVEVLDGDELRHTVCQGLGFTREDRFENIRRVVYLAKLLSRNGVDVLVSAITPYKDMRDYARGELPGYAEIYVECPLQVCEARDVKGLYAKARKGEVAAFTGISDPYETPEHPDLTLRTQAASLEANGAAVVRWLERHSPLPETAPREERVRT